jgi:hypothetical protein
LEKQETDRSAVHQDEDQASLQENTLMRSDGDWGEEQKQDQSPAHN